MTQAGKSLVLENCGVLVVENVELLFVMVLMASLVTFDLLGLSVFRCWDAGDFADGSETVSAG